MGWRLGQGIGPRISLKRRKEQDILAYDPLTGNRLASGSLDIPEDDQEASKHSYAPRDTPVLLVTRKDNTRGLGYVPGLGLNQSLGDGNMGGGSGPKLAGI
jgi:G patch domain-containing protein 1